MKAAEAKTKFEKVFDAQKWRRNFPALRQSVHEKPLVYLDNAATTQKPQCVMDAMNQFYARNNANIHRGIHALSEKATQDFEDARVKVQRFLNAQASREIIFVRGATEAINLVSQSYGRAFIGEGDEIIISWMEHHSNIVPWQILCQQTGAKLRVIPISDEGEILMERFEKLLNKKTKFLAVTHLSNALGTIVPVKDMIRMAHAYEVPVLVDGAQAVPHLVVDVEDLNCDFYVFSGHKLYGPTGIGVVYGKAELLEKMPPYQGGGDMISRVTFEGTRYNVLPYKFEAGTPHIAGAVGLGVAVDYLTAVGLENIAAYEKELLEVATDQIGSISGLRIIGTAREKASILSFILEGIHAHDVGTILDREGVAIRAGHHCAMPVMDRFNIPATARASFAFYNTTDEIETLARAIHRAKEVFG